MRILIIVLLLMPTLCSSQIGDWSVGVKYSPFFYWNYNAKDWDNMPKSYPKKITGFNGSFFGIEAKKTLNNFTIGVGLKYSSQTQGHYLTSSSSVDTAGVITYYYNQKYTRHLSYIHLPIEVSKSIEIGYRSGLFLNGSIGIQLSYLTSYKSTLLSYDNEIGSSNEPNYLISKTIITPNKVYQKIHSESEGYRTRNISYPFIYSRWLVGIVSSISLQKKVFNSFVISLGAQFEYDFSDSEVADKKGYIDLSFRDGNDGEPRPKSHNIRIGPILSLKYIFQ